MNRARADDASQMSMLIGAHAVTHRDRVWSTWIRVGGAITGKRVVLKARVTSRARDLGSPQLSSRQQRARAHFLPRHVDPVRLMSTRDPFCLSRFSRPLKCYF